MRRQEITPKMMQEIQFLLDGVRTEAVGRILGCSGNSVRTCLRGTTLRNLNKLALDRINLILDAKEAGLNQRETPLTFELEERRLEVRAQEGLRMWAERHENVFVVEVRQPLPEETE